MIHDDDDVIIDVNVVRSDSHVILVTNRNDSIPQAVVSVSQKAFQSRREFSL